MDVHRRPASRLARTVTTSHGDAMIIPEALLRLCAEQLGVIARYQLRELLAATVTDDLLRSGRFERLHRGVHALRGSAVDDLRPAIAAALRCGPTAILTGPAGLALHRLEGTDLGRHFAILLPPGRRVVDVPFTVLRDPDARRRVTHVGAVRIASPVDALLESAALFDVPPRRLRLAHDRLRWEGLLHAGQLQRRAAELGLGSQLAGGELLAMDPLAPTGDGERELWHHLHRFDPPPQPQVWVTPRRCTDFLFEECRLAVEYQGRPDHGTKLGRSRDRAREDELAQAGIRIVYVDAADLRSPRLLLSRIASALTARGDELGVVPPRLLPA